MEIGFLGKCVVEGRTGWIRTFRRGLKVCGSIRAVGRDNGEVCDCGVFVADGLIDLLLAGAKEVDRRIESGCDRGEDGEEEEEGSDRREMCY